MSGKVTKKARKGLLATTAFGMQLLQGSFALAQPLPTGGQVVGGQVGISQNGATMTIDQATQRGAIDWQSFDIAPGNTVQFNQPNAQAMTLNRIAGGVRSAIEGSLLANGQVLIQNANGVLFGKGATVNVGSLLATTKSIDPAQFMNGGPFDLKPTGISAGIVNDGTIDAQGFVTFIGDQVRNTGNIAAPQVVLAAGDAATVALANGQGVEVTLSNAAANALVETSGNIHAGSDGSVLITARGANTVLDTVINMSGVIRAGTVVADAAHTGDIALTGNIDASNHNPGGKGGVVVLSGDRVGLFGNASVNVTGNLRGGLAIVGGDALGKVPGTAAAALIPEVAFANYTQVDAGATIDAGSTEGDGGFVETSGLVLSVQGNVGGGAPRGKAGEWLIDPLNVVISPNPDANYSGGNLGGDASPFGPNPPGSPQANVSNVTISNALNNGLNVNITTIGSGGGCISIGGNITTSNTSSLTLQTSNGAIGTCGAIPISISTSGSGRLDLKLLADVNGGVNMDANVTIALGGGNLTVSASRNDGTPAVILNGALNLANGISNITGTSNTGTGVLLNFAGLNATGATLTVTGNSTNGSAPGVNLTNVPANYTVSTGNITFNGSSRNGAGLVGLANTSSLTVTGGNLALISYSSRDGFGVDLRGAAVSVTGGKLTVEGYVSNIGLAPIPPVSILPRGAVVFANASASGDGVLNITGCTSLGSSSCGTGVLFVESGKLTVSDNADVTVHGNAASGIAGVVWSGEIDAGGGRLNVTGEGAGFGLELTTLTLTVSGNADVAITGNAAGTGALGGVELNLAATTVAGNGTLTVTGNVTNGAAPGVMLIDAPADYLVSTGNTTFKGSSWNGSGLVGLPSNSLTVTGGNLALIGRSGGNDLHGVDLNGAVVAVTAGTLTIDGCSSHIISGRGVSGLGEVIATGGVLNITGHSVGGGSESAGVAFLGNVAGKLTVSGDANVTITGTADGCIGVAYLSEVNASGGILTVTGVGYVAGVSFNTVGLVPTLGSVTVSGDANVTITGTADFGEGMSGLGEVSASGDGVLSITGNSQDSSQLPGVRFGFPGSSADAPGSVTVSGSADVAIVGDSAMGPGVTGLVEINANGGELHITGNSSDSSGGSPGVELAWAGSSVILSNVTVNGEANVTIFGNSASGAGVTGLSDINAINGALSVTGISHGNLLSTLDPSILMPGVEFGDGLLDLMYGPTPTGNVTVGTAGKVTLDGTSDVNVGLILDLGKVTITGGTLTAIGLSNANQPGVNIIPSTPSSYNLNSGNVTFNGTSLDGPGLEGLPMNLNVSGGANLTIVGNSGGTSDGVMLDGGSVNVDNATMSVTGTARGSGFGVAIYDSPVNTTGSGVLTIAGSSAAELIPGVDIGAVTVLTARDGGTVSIHGQSTNYGGVQIRTNAEVHATTSGSVDITGQSDNGGNGVFINAGGMVKAADGGTLDISGTASGATGNGVSITASGVVEVADGGSMSITGNAAAENGVWIIDIGTVSVSNGTLIVTGNSSSANAGVNIGNVPVDYTVSIGNVTFNGTSANGPGLMGLSNANLTVNSTGNLTIIGNSGGSCAGVETSGNIAVSGGTLNITGKARGIGQGVFINTTGSFTQSGGTVTIDGASNRSASGTKSSGVELAVPVVNVTGGTLTITGHAENMGMGGVELSNTTGIFTVSNGTVTINGSAPNAAGVYSCMGLTVNGNGQLTITGNAGGTRDAILLTSVNVADSGKLTIDGTTTNGAGTRIAGSINVTNGTLDITGNRTNGTAWGVGGVVLGGASQTFAMSGGVVTIEGTEEGTSQGFGVEMDYAAVTVTGGTLDITGHGQGPGSPNSDGVLLSNSSGATFAVSGGNVTINGNGWTGVTSDMALTVNGSTGNLTINGNSAAWKGACLSSAVRVTENGTLTVTGNSGGSGIAVDLTGNIAVADSGNATISGTSNTGIGVQMNLGLVDVTGGNLTVTGRSENGPSSSAGVRLSGFPTNYILSAGNVTIDGASNASAEGLDGIAGCITVNGFGHLKLIGTSCAGASGMSSGFSPGIEVSDFGTLDITGDSGGQSIVGVLFSPGSKIDVSGDGILNITGIARSVLGGQSTGVRMFSPGVSVSDSASVNITGCSSAYYGVYINGGVLGALGGSLNISGESTVDLGTLVLDSTVLVDNAAMNVEGTAGTTAVQFQNSGIDVINGGSLNVSGDDLNGTGYGVSINSNSKLNVDDGFVHINGTAVDGTGVAFRLNSSITMQGSDALLVVNGTSNTGDGVLWMNFSGLNVTEGTLTVTGNSTNGTNAGVNLGTAASNFTVSGGNVTLNGASKSGMGLTGSVGSLTVNSTGNLTIIGTSGGANIGVNLGGQINVADSGNATITGTSNTGMGAQMNLGALNVTGGTLVVTGTDLAGTAAGLNFTNAPGTYNLNLGNVTFNGTSAEGRGLNGLSSNLSVSGVGNLTVIGNSGGSNLGVALTALNVSGNGHMTVCGTSNQGSGMNVSGLITVNGSGELRLNGSTASTSGQNGMNITNVSLSEDGRITMCGAAPTAGVTASSGSGVLVEDGRVVNIAGGTLTIIGISDGQGVERRHIHAKQRYRDARRDVELLHWFPYGRRRSHHRRDSGYQRDRPGQHRRCLDKRRNNGQRRHCDGQRHGRRRRRRRGHPGSVDGERLWPYDDRRHLQQ